VALAQASATAVFGAECVTMWCPPIESMALHEGGSAFLALIWQEMFDPNTPDTYQPRLSHLPSVSEDLLNVAERALTSSRWEKHVHIVQQELEALTKANEAFVAGMPTYQWALLHLSRSKSFTEIVALAKTLQQAHETFEKRALQHFEQAVERLPKEKKAVVKSIRKVATIGIRSGRESSEFLKIATSELLERTPNQVANRILRSIRRRSSMFDCIFAVKGEPTAVQQIARKVGFRLLSQRDLPHHPDVGEFASVAGDAVYVAIEETAFFSGQAVRQASRKLREATDVYNFFKNARELSLLSLAVAVDAKQKATVVGLGEHVFEHLKPRKNAVDVTQQVLDVRPERLSGRVLNALEHFALAHVGASQKVQLVNLWSAVECLAGSSRRESAIATVCHSVAPIVMWRRVEKILRYVARSLQEFRVSGATESLGDGFPKTEKSVSAECLLLTLSKPEDHSHITALLKFCAPHPLLLNRVFTLWSTFSDPRVVAAELRFSLQRTAWNLWRIYRARNLIVHEGVDVPHVPILLNQLHSCFSTVLSRVLGGMSHNPTWGVDEAIAHARARAGYLLETLEQRPNCLRVDDFFILPQRRDGSKPW
jgi:HPt (histidine-containing phosphotransfer) domain-containing protein